MRANMRSVSSTDEIFFVRIASAACKAEAKSSWFAAGATAVPEFPFRGADGEAFGPAKSDFAAVISAETLDRGNVVAATASGTEARKSRRFICGMVKAKWNWRNSEEFAAVESRG